MLLGGSVGHHPGAGPKAQPLDNYIDLRHLPRGRMTSAVRLVRQLAAALGDAELVALCDALLVRLAEARSLQVG